MDITTLLTGGVAAALVTAGAHIFTHFLRIGRVDSAADSRVAVAEINAEQRTLRLLLARVADLEERESALLTQQQEWVRTIAALEARVATLEGQKRVDAEAIAEKVTEIALLRHQAEERDRYIDGLEKENKRLNDRVQELAEQRVALQEALDEARKFIAGANTQSAHA